MQTHSLISRKLLICVSDPANLEHMANSIRSYFGNLLDIVAVSPSKLFDISFQPDAAIVSYLTESIVRERFPEIDIILQQRDVSGQALEKVVSLPTNSNALVVNKPLSAAVETRNSLVELGIDHINMTAYAPRSNVDISNVDTVIYTGIIKQCPKLNCQYIDIGLRKVSLYTIIDIIRVFNLPSDYAKEYYNDNIQQITASCYRIDNALKQVNHLKNNFEKICNINNNITFVVNDKKEIVLFNDAAKKYFEIKDPASIMGMKYNAIFSSYPELISYISSSNPLSDTLITLGDQQLLISSFDMDIDKNKAYILLPLSTHKKREGLIRKKLQATGFVARYTFDDILGSSDLINQSKTLANIYAKTDFPVLITGESGTGKELFAQAIHNTSSRKEGNFVAINFAALPETLAESELFGYMEGAFTGASKSGKTGMFELAHKGTIFLDEIGDASLPVQAKLLRVLEEKEVVRVGGIDVIPVDVRIVCATNKNLETAISEGTFREDLYYRIKVLNLQLKPLRQRREDIMETISKLLVGDGANRLANLPNTRNFLTNYDWPGNAREVRTVAEYINMLSTLPSEKEAIDMLELYLKNNLHKNDPEQTMQSVTHTINAIDESTSTGSGNYMSHDLTVILQSIYELQSHGLTAGRNSICKTPEAIKMNLTEAKAKTRLKRLESMGYITVGKTKQGVILTDLGYQWIIRNSNTLENN